jgi:hypothetical protein
MEFLKLEDGMELTVMPLPFDSNSYFYEYNMIWDIINKKYININPNSIIDNNIHGILRKIYFDHYKSGKGNFMGIYNFHFVKRFFVYVLYNNELYITNFGVKLKQKLEECSYKYDKKFKFRKMNIQIRMMGDFPNYDRTTISDNYYNTKYKDLNNYMCSLNDDDFNFINNFMIKNSCTNPNNSEVMSDIFNRLELTDFKIYVRKEKINSIKEKIC